MIPIEKNIPYGATRCHGAKGDYESVTKWPWYTMQPGDSFTVATKREMASARNSLYMHRKTVNCKFPTWWVAKVKKTSSGYRLWLIDKNNPETPVDTTP